VQGRDESLERPHSGQDIAAPALRALWACVRLPVLALLVIVEPVVRLILSALALLLVLTALFLEVVSSRAIPFWGMLGAAIGCVALLVLYEQSIRGLSR
jgi:hypothetical protein